MDLQSPILNSPSPILVRPRAFTLIELMISIALVLLLILGVNQIFSYTTQAVGAGQAINAAIRDSRAFGACASSDFTSMVGPGTGPNDSASLIIYNSAVAAFRDRRDQAGDLDGNPLTRDLNNDKTEGDANVPGEIIPRYTYNYRNHRVDTISFFARNVFARQTGNLGTMVDNMYSQEAWIWYGHLWLPDNAGNYFFADNNSPTGTSPTFCGIGNASQNPNNLYATQFVLGRVATLLQEKSVDSASGTIFDSAGYPQRFLNRRNPYPTATTPATELDPLWAGAAAATGSNPNDSSSWILQDARFDLAATSIKSFRDKFLSFLTANPSANWWDQMMSGNTYPSPQLASGLGTRFKCNPFISKPMSSDVMAQTTPYCLGGCGQFIVEYAGDYRMQDNTPTDLTYGQNVIGSNGTAAGQDQQIDYVLIPPPNVVPVPPRSQWRKQICWYGLPRNTTGYSTLNGNNGDVVPLSWWLGAQQKFEHFNPASPITYDGSGNVTAVTPGGEYICAFGPNDTKPKLIRITITLDDATGRLPEGQTYQYVFAVP